ncbi:MAG: hypothetical protein PHZ02_04045 [Desulfocapsaceae bacterium]|nr:hypothetical protein [Desulfocapsaceae bacterium]
MNKVAGRRKVQLTLVYTVLVSLFLLACIYQKLAADIDAGNWQKALTRVGLVGLVSFFVVWRLDQPTQLSMDKFLKTLSRLAISTLFLVVIFFPLFSQTSFLSKSVKEVVHSIVKDQNSKLDKIYALLKTFSQSYSEYTDKNFVLPKLFIHLNALVKVYGLGISPNNNIAVGKNGFYFEGWGARQVEKGIVENFDNIADYMGQIPFSADELRQWKRTLEERKYWLKEQGIEYVFVLAPTKALVYPENLPNNLQSINKGLTRYDQLSQFLRTETDLQFVDLRPPLLRAKEKRAYPLLFYKTDFHWNYYGAFIAYQAIVDLLREKFPRYNLVHPKFSDFKLLIDEHWAHDRFMNMVGLPVALHKNEHHITMVPKAGGRYDSALDLPPGGIYDFYPPERPVVGVDGKSMNLRLILNPKAPIRSILLLGDSFLEKCVYFFSADAQRVLNYRTIVNFPDMIMQYEKPDIVIQEILNMFILRPPPQNPQGFAAAYLKGKFADNAEHTIISKSSKDFTRKMKGESNIFEIRLSDIPHMAAAEVRVAKVALNAVQDGKAEIRMYTADNKLCGTSAHDLVIGLNSLYFEVPAKAIDRIVISGAGNPVSLFTPVAFELRSDHAVEVTR